MNRDDVLDRAALLTRVGGEIELLFELVDLFISECPKHLVQIREAVASGDPQSIESAAHAYKGMLETLSASAAATAALRLEMIARDGDVASATVVLPVLEEETNRLLPVLATLESERTRRQF